MHHINASNQACRRKHGDSTTLSRLGSSHPPRHEETNHGHLTSTRANKSHTKNRDDCILLDQRSPPGTRLSPALFPCANLRPGGGVPPHFITRSTFREHYEDQLEAGPWNNPQTELEASTRILRERNIFLTRLLMILPPMLVTRSTSRGLEVQCWGHSKFFDPM